MDQTDSSSQNTGAKTSPSRLECLTGCGCYAFFTGLCFLPFLFMWTFSITPGNDRFAFVPLVWSPDGQYLAFAVEEEFMLPERLFVVDADGNNLRKLVDAPDFDPPNGRIMDIRWNVDSDAVLFEYRYWSKADGATSYGPKYYAAAITNDQIQPISAAEFSAVDTVADNQEMAVPITACSAPRHIESRVVHANGLIAQSACPQAMKNGNWIQLRTDCVQDLQVCNAFTGEMVFTLTDDDLEKISVLNYLPVVLLLGSGLLIIVGFPSLVIGLALLLLNRIIHSLKPAFRQKVG